MKIIFACLAAIIFLFTDAQGQIKRWEVKASIGGGSYPFLKDGGRFLDINVLGSEITGNAYTAKALYQTNNRKIKIGLSTVYNSVKHYHIGFSLFGYDPSYMQSTRNIFAIMPTFNYTYLKRRNNQLYAEASFGATFSHQKFYNQKSSNNAINSAFQCTLLGYRLGDKIGFFTQLGYGYEGILQVGVSGTF